LVGWHGLWNILPAYSSYPASTICVIVYTYAGSSGSITTRRVVGVVLGKVTGTAFQLGFAVKDFWKACCFATSMWFVVAGTFFLYLHADRDLGYVCCVTVAFAASSMIPPDCTFRDLNTTDYADITPGLLNTIMSTVIGSGILTVVDMFLASNATNQARQRLLRALRRTRLFLTSVVSQGDLRVGEGLMDDLCALQEIIPYAAAEPMWWRPPFKVELYQSLEQHLRVVVSLLDTIKWVMEPMGQHTNSTANWVSAAPVPEDGTGSVMVRFSASAASETTFRPLLTLVHSEVASMLRHVEALATSVTESSGEQEGAAQEIRRQLQSSLYTASVVQCVAVGSSAAFARYVKPASAMWGSAEGNDSIPREVVFARAPLVSSSSRPESLRSRVRLSCSQLHGTISRMVAPLVNQVLHEPLGEDLLLQSLTESMHIGGEHGSSLEDPFKALREEAILRRASFPHTDDSCRAEMMIRLVKSLVLEMEKMQLDLLEY
jgi:hypothetical protein